MLKKINVSILILLSIFTCYLDVSFALFIPIIMSLFKDISTHRTTSKFNNIYKQNMYLIISLALSIVTCYFLLTKYFISLSIIIILVIIVFILSCLINNKLYISILYYICNIILAIISITLTSSGKDVSSYIILSIISIIEYYLLVSLDNTKSTIISPIDIMIIIGLLGVVSVSFSNTLVFIYAIYFTIYKAKDNNKLSSTVISIIIYSILLIFYHIPESTLYLLVSLFYILNINYHFFYINVVMTILLFTSSYDNKVIYTIMILSTIFACLDIILWKLNKSRDIEKLSTTKIYDNALEIEYMNFASFLDYFSDTFKYKAKYNSNLAKSFEVIIDKNCNRCNKKDECFKVNKHILSTYFKDTIEKEESKELRKVCPSYRSIKETSDSLRYQMKKDLDATNDVLQAILKSCSHILDIYHKDISSKKMLSSKIIFDIEKCANLFFVSNIYYHKVFVDDYHIELKLKMRKKAHLEPLLNSLSNIMPKAKITTHLDEDVYSIHLTVGKIIDLKYGYGVMPSVMMELCGDNYLIRNYDNSHMLFAISDGMGKGFDAYSDSKKALELLDAICFCSSSLNTNLEIINLLYILQGYTERYSTIDALDINCSTAFATFYKLGAASSFIIHHNNSYDIIENKSLPLGIEDNIMCKQVSLQKNDLIIMTSDGIIDNVENSYEIICFIQSIKDKIPEEIALDILHYTSNNKVKNKDDMSVIVIKVE